MEPDEETIDEIPEQNVAMSVSVAKFQNEEKGKMYNNQLFPAWIVDLYAMIAIDKEENGADASRFDEMQQMIDEEVFEAVQLNQLSNEDFMKVIPSQIFTIAKESPTGEFIKWKSRLVADGHRETIEPGMDNSSPTAAKEAVFSAVIALYRRPY